SSLLRGRLGRDPHHGRSPPRAQDPGDAQRASADGAQEQGAAGDGVPRRCRLMPSQARAVPPGYVAFAVGAIEVVSANAVASAIPAALQAGSSTLYGYARRHTDAKPLAGRGVAYAVPLPGPRDIRAVVRHNQHGGLLGPLTRDLFLAPTRAPLE